MKELKFNIIAVKDNELVPYNIFEDMGVRREIGDLFFKQLKRKNFIEQLFKIFHWYCKSDLEIIDVDNENCSIPFCDCMQIKMNIEVIADLILTNSDIVRGWARITTTPLEELVFIKNNLQQ